MNSKIETIKDGVQEKIFSSWKDFVEFLLGDVKRNPNLIWRGQHFNWPLLPSLERILNDQNVNDPKTRLLIREEHLKKFQFAIRGRVGPNPPDFSNPKKHRELWALGRHYGLATPLLDWTESPFVAAFFAFEDKSNKDEKKKENIPNRAIIALDKKKIEEVDPRNLRKILDQVPLTSHPLTEDDFRLIEFYKPLSHFNPNLVSQQGLFTIFKIGNLDLEKWINMAFKDESNDPVFSRYFLPDEDREPFLVFLNRMNINRLTLFPDLSGASEYCNQSLKIREY